MLQDDGRKGTTLRSSTKMCNIPLEALRTSRADGWARNIYEISPRSSNQSAPSHENNNVLGIWAVKSGDQQE